MKNSTYTGSGKILVAALVVAAFITICLLGVLANPPAAEGVGLTDASISTPLPGNQESPNSNTLLVSDTDEVKPNSEMNQDIVNLLKAYEKAVNTGNVEAAMALYGSDPILMPQFSQALVGREAVKASYDKVFNALKLNVVLSIHEIVEMGDLAYGLTSSTGEIKINASGKMMKEGNNELFIFRKEQGQWKPSGRHFVDMVTDTCQYL